MVEPTEAGADERLVLVAARPDRGFGAADLDQIAPLASALAVAVPGDGRRQQIEAGFRAALGEEAASALFAEAATFDEVAERFLRLRARVALVDGMPRRRGR